MSKLTLDQFKTETENEVKTEKRLTLDQFKKQASNDNSEELEKLTGGSMASCHSWWDKVRDFLYTPGHPNTSYYP